MRVFQVLFILLTTVLLSAQSALTDNYIYLYKHIAIQEMERTGIPASITLAAGESVRPVPIEILGQRLDVTVSIGVAAYPAHGSDPRSLLQRADEALYLTKENGTW